LPLAVGCWRRTFIGAPGRADIRCPTACGQLALPCNKYLRYIVSFTKLYDPRIFPTIEFEHSNSGSKSGNTKLLAKVVFHTELLYCPESGNTKFAKAVFHTELLYQ